MEHEPGRHWNDVIGAFMINFGSVEMMAYQWIMKYSNNNKALFDKATGQPFSERVRLVRDLVAKSNLPADEKKKADASWAEILHLAKTRNIIAHSPLISRTVNGQTEMGFLDVKQMKGPSLTMVVTPLLFRDILHAGSRVSRILAEIVPPVSGDPTQS